MIHIIQCLCPQRHAIYAIAYDPDFMADDVAMAEFREQVTEWIRKGVINPWCGICGSREWAYEQRSTKYKTVSEARPELKMLELENMLSRHIIEMRKEEKN